MNFDENRAGRPKPIILPYTSIAVEGRETSEKRDDLFDARHDTVLICAGPHICKAVSELGV